MTERIGPIISFYPDGRMKVHCSNEVAALYGLHLLWIKPLRHDPGFQRWKARKLARDLKAFRNGLSAPSTRRDEARTTAITAVSPSTKSRHRKVAPEVGAKHQSQWTANPDRRQPVGSLNNSRRPR